jgi:hypothetical protein
LAGEENYFTLTPGVTFKWCLTPFYYQQREIRSLT